ncbi:Ribosomal RNA small subunit methyltransferase I [Paraliobacillus sp. PM-2]|uniref:16S rRNA (cytidine(1402)-2'-O)-methyltransferase n=1 Tax=Paraliobacillus sp. PM-2 TaxID=1462524 RepID=UPI00061C4846|nr:16S rRNA (cytidine(1402)-2'-O)-methyltransferase [Paraliobacillus sp. PM-2]CQR47498.1 Ribosomal RNA small subunit methyltransferase I [Paraliobacillus sp. PM-2]
MQIQKSFESNRTVGTLFVVPTPIGNLEDITIRALNTLREVDFIAAEDTRNTKKLLNYFEINQSLVSYHEHSNQQREQMLIEAMQNGKNVALVSDAGMPAVSDPGNPVIEAAIKQSIPVVVLPGANAGLCALVASGLDTNHFYFYGFLPRKSKDKKATLQRLSQLTDTILLYESPYRVKETVAELYEYFGNRSVVIGRELTKRFEEYVRGTLEEIIAWTDTGTVKGEFCLVIEGIDNESVMENNWWKDLSIEAHVNHYVQQEQLSSKDAIKKVSVERNIQKREVYQAYHINNK